MVISTLFTEAPERSVTVPNMDPLIFCARAGDTPTARHTRISVRPSSNALERVARCFGMPTACFASLAEAANHDPEIAGVSWPDFADDIDSLSIEKHSFYLNEQGPRPGVAIWLVRQLNTLLNASS